MKTLYRKPNPHLFDVAIDEIQTALNNECAWLNNIFGRCERLVKEINGRKEFTANWYKAKNDYILIAPDEGLGNFCFFVLDEPTDLENYFAGDVTRSTIGFSLIVWCDLRTIGEGRDTEAVKEELLQILNGRTHLRSGRMTIDKVYERAENIFREFDYDEIDNQYLMHPFAGFRIQGELIVDTLCDAYIPPTPPVIEPYIDGHIINGASTFTFKVNGNESVTVPVDINGNWKWVVDRTINALNNAFANLTNIDRVNFTNVNISGSAASMFDSCTSIREVLIDNSLNDATTFYALMTSTGSTNCVFNFKGGMTFEKTQSCWRMFVRCSKVVGLENCKFSNVTNIYQMFYYYTGDTIDLGNAELTKLTTTDLAFAYCYNLKNLNIKKINKGIALAQSSNLTAQSVINLFNAVAADNLTFTFHPIVGTMIDAALQDPTNYIYQAYWAADARGYHINYVY